MNYIEKGIVVMRSKDTAVVEVNGITKIVRCNDILIEQGQEVSVADGLAYK